MKKILRIGLVLVFIFLVLTEILAIATGSRNVLIQVVDPKCIPLGGSGLFADHDYIITHSDKNEIKYSDGKVTKRWAGESWHVPQRVVVWHGDVVNMQAPPREFKEMESTVISFKPDRIDFANHQSGMSCFYERDVEDVYRSE